MASPIQTVAEELATALGRPVATTEHSAPHNSNEASFENLASYIDHTLLKPEATPDDIRRLCDEAIEHRFASVCVNGCYVALCAERLNGSDIGICSVVGFPLGAMTTSAKAFEARQAVEDGATEIDMVLGIGRLRAGECAEVFQDIEAVVRAAAPSMVKVIIEAPLLDERQKVAACLIAREARAAYIKTSTGFGAAVATIDDVRLMRRIVGRAMGVKAAGGIRDAATARAMLRAGASRLGTSASLAIIGVA